MQLVFNWVSMTRDELTEASESYIRKLIKQHISSHTHVFLYGSRAQGNHRWNSDYDLWIDADLSPVLLDQVTEELNESFVPFKVDIVTTPKLKGRFAEEVKRKAILWM